MDRLICKHPDDALMPQWKDDMGPTWITSCCWSGQEQTICWTAFLFFCLCSQRKCCFGLILDHSYWLCWNRFSTNIHFNLRQEPMWSTHDCTIFQPHQSQFLLRLTSKYKWMAGPRDIVLPVCQFEMLKRMRLYTAWFTELHTLVTETPQSFELSTQQIFVRTNWLPLLVKMSSVEVISKLPVMSVKSQFACDKRGCVRNLSCRPCCWILLDLPTLHLLISPFQASILQSRFSRQHPPSWDYLPQHYFHLFFFFPNSLSLLLVLSLSLFLPPSLPPCGGINCAGYEVEC